MSIKVQKYIANLGKSVTYTAADVIKQKFDYINDFKNENQDVFKQAYVSFKDYKQTITSVKKAITNNKLTDAARVGFDSIMYSITTGDFYAKNKENEVIEKYGGTLFKDLDIDDDDFDWNSEDLSTGDKIIATAIKKNSKINTAITTEAIVKTGKAQMDVSKENTMLLYTQNERLINKLDGGLANITSFLKQNAESNAKVQNQMNDNLNKFMTNVDNNVVKLTKQMDELLEMQRNIYNPPKEEKKKRTGYDDIISSNGVLNIKEYLKMVKKNTFNTINEKSGGVLSQLFGDTFGEGTNLLAQFTANPLRNLLSFGINKALGKGFDDASKQLNKTLEGIVPAIFARLNAAAKKDDGFLSFLGKILGVKTGPNESVDTSKYNKGPIPFDGITKRAITDVIPYYLRKMTSVLTGGEEMIYDFETGRWSSMRSVKQNYDRITNSAQLDTEKYIVNILEGGLGRSLRSSFDSSKQYKMFNDGIKSLATKLQNTGSFNAIDTSDLRGPELEVYKMLQYIMRLEDSAGNDRRYKTVNGKKIESGLGRSEISNFDKSLRDFARSQNSAIKALNENSETITRIITSEGITGDIKSYHGKSYVNRYGDITDKTIMNMPISQVLVKAKDEYGVTLYQYLRDMGTSLRVIKGYSGYLSNLPAINNNTINEPPSRRSFKAIDMADILRDGDIKYDITKDVKNSLKYYEEQNRKDDYEESRRWQIRIQRERDRAKSKGKSYPVATSYNFESEGEEVGLKRIVTSNEAELEAKAELRAILKQQKELDEKYDKIGHIIGKDRAEKLKNVDKNFDIDKSLAENMRDVKDFSGKLLIFGKWMSEKVFRAPKNTITDTIIKVDFWLQKLIFGDTDKENNKSLFQRIKSSIDEHFKNIQEKITDGIRNISQKITESGPFKYIKKFFLGEKDEDGIYSNGVFGSFVGGVQKGLRKNAKDVWEYTKNQARDVKKVINNKLTPSPTPESVIPNPAQLQHQQKLDEISLRLNNIKNRIQLKEALIQKLKERLQKLDINSTEYINYNNKIKNKENELQNLKNQYNTLANKYNSLVDEADRLGMQNIEKISTMAVGGVNKTGKPFQSVLSAGEYLNGNKITQTGIYTIPKDGVVVNPANASTRAKQARNEKKFINTLKTNANTNDNLATITDRNQRAEFYGSMASRGIIGGGIGLLAGGPLIGATIGAASSLTKSTNAFANMLFGDAIIDKETGEIAVDEKGNIKRNNNGIISKELMDAVPSIKKFGLGGLIAGLITPIGPLGGVLAGAALGFAKKSEMFQGSLFGEDGIISDEKLDKLKKAKVNISAGAVLGAFTGPFGLLGNALIGATVGYATTTDKFKDAILGKRDNPNDPNSRRHGGVVGVIKTSVQPLKDLGKNIVDGITDAIFGKKNGNGKREGGLFGLVKDSIISPLADGTKSIIKELKNKAIDIGFMAKKLWRTMQKRAATKDSIGVFGERANSIAGKAIKLATGGAKIALSPYIGISKGVRGIGNIFKKKRIRSGRADDMTARERLKFRGEHGMPANDAFSKFDADLSNMSNEEMQLLMDRLSYFVDGEEALDKEENYLNNSTKEILGDFLAPAEKTKLLAMLSKKDYKAAERFISTKRFKGRDGTGVTDEQRKYMLILSRKYAKDKANIDDRFNKARNSARISNEELKETFGLNVDLSNPHDVDNIKRYLRREITHNEAGLTEEDLEFDKQREFWTDEKSPLKTVNDSVTRVVSTLDNIYEEIKLNNEYNSLSYEEKLKYGSKENYINANKSKSPDSDNTSVKQSSDKLNGSNNKNDYNDLVDKAPDSYQEKVKEIVERGARIFDTLVMKELRNPEKINQDITELNLSEEIKDGQTKVELVRNNVILTRYKTVYTFDIKYEYDMSSNSVTLSNNQSKVFESERDRYITDYAKSCLPKDDKNSSYMSLIDMAKKSIKGAGFFVVASMVPGGSLTLLAALGLKKLNKKYNFTGKIRNQARRGKLAIKHVLSSHEINKNSAIQKAREKLFKWDSKAEKALEKAVQNKDVKLDEIAQEKYNLNYSDLDNSQQAIVNKEFMNRFKDEKRAKQITGHGLIGNVKALSGTIKSGVKNAIQGGINFAKEKKKKAQDEDRFLGKFFNKLDKWEAKKDKKSFEGKKDSKLAKIIKWLFIGGIAVPILVGFVKDKIMPAIHEKIQPWLSKTKDKLIGVKNPQTGEYENGLVSGIVNPIRKFFKDKFQNVHDWFHNEGKFNNENSGFKGLINNLKGVGMYAIDLWKSGATTIIEDYLPKLIAGIISNLPSILGSSVKGIVTGVGELFKNWFGKEEAGKGDQAKTSISIKDYFPNSTKDAGGQGNNRSAVPMTTSYGFNNTVGGIIAVPIPGTKSSNNSTIIYDQSQTDYNIPLTTPNNNVKSSVDKDGNTKLINKSNETATTEFIDDSDMVSSGVNESGDPIYYKRSDKHRTQPYSRTDVGQYIRLDRFYNVADSEIQGNKVYDEMIKKADNMEAGETELYTGSMKKMTNRAMAIKALLKASINPTDAKGLASAINASGKVTSAIGKATKFVPIFGKIPGTILDKGGKFVSNHSDTVPNFLRNTIGSKFDNLVQNNSVLKKVNDFGLRISGDKQAIYDHLDKKLEKALASGDNEAAEKIMSKMSKIEAKMNKTGFVQNIKNKVAGSKVGQTFTNIKNSETLKKVNNVANKITHPLDSVKEKVVTKVKSTKVGSFMDEAIDGVKGLFKKGKDKIIKFFKDLFTDNKIFKMLAGVNKNMTKEGAEKLAKETGEKLVKECVEEGAEKIAVKAGAGTVKAVTASSGIGIVINIVLAVADFLLGMDDARNILGITGDDIPWSYRFFAGLINTLQDIPYAGMLFGIIGSSNIAGFIIDILGPILFPSLVEGLQRDREEAEKALEYYNSEHDSHYTLEEYNNKKHKTFSSTVGGAFKSFGSWTGGKDAAVTNAMEARHNIADANEQVTDIRENLEGIASHMWEEKDFDDFEIDKETYGGICAEVIDKIVILLNGLDEGKLQKVLDSSEKIHQGWWENFGTSVLKTITFGAADVDPFKDAWNDGYERGVDYLGLDKNEFKNTSLIKTVAGVASVFVKSCGGAGLKWKIIDIVISVFVNALSKKLVGNEKRMVDESNSRITDINGTYASNISNKNNIFGGAPSVDTSSSSEEIVTNANANSKLSKLANKNLLDILNPINVLNKTNIKDNISGIINSGMDILDIINPLSISKKIKDGLTGNMSISDVKNDINNVINSGMDILKLSNPLSMLNILPTNANANSNLSKLSNKNLLGLLNPFNILNKTNIKDNISGIINSGANILDIINPLSVSKKIKDGLTGNMNISDVKNDINSVINSGASILKLSNPLSMLNLLPTNTNANSNLSKLPVENIIDLLNPFNNMNTNNKSSTSNAINIGGILSSLFENSINKITGGFSNIPTIFSTLEKKNKQINDSIDSLSLLPNDEKYWEISLDGKNPFASGLYNFVESMNRVIKAPFSLASASLGGGLTAIASTTSSNGNSNNSSSSGSSNNSGSNNDNSNSSNKSSSSGSSSENIFTKLAKASLNVIKSFGKIFGKGKDDEDDDSGLGDSNDPYHIYQRDYHGSFRTAGDSENQTVADSGCGPAAAASLLRMYGKKGDMNNAVNYALNNKYKEVDGGTYPQYFNDYLNKNGISTNSSANNADVVNSLVHNKPVILMGRDANNSGNTPYGSKYSHYVVARGLDSNGNVIVEDSEDKRGSTRYSLAETLKNSTVKITTGNGKYGRAKQSITESYISGVNAVVGSAVTSIISNAVKASGVTKKSSSSSDNTKAVSNNGVVGELSVDSDVKTSCGYTAEQLKNAIKSIHPEGCSAEQFPDAAIAVEKSKGVNALFTVAVAVQEHGWNGTVGINTTGANWGNWNVFNIQGSPNSSNGRWKDYKNLEDAFNGFAELIMGETYYGAGLTTPEKIGSRYCPPNAAENAGYGLWGEHVCKVANLIVSHISGSGRGVLPSISSKFMNNVNSVIGYYTAKTVADSIVDGGTDSNSEKSSNKVITNVNVNVDSDTCIICGDSITYGLSSTNFGKRAMGLSSGTTDKNQTTPAGSYSSIFESKSDIIANATDAIFFWGMNEVFTNLSPEEYFARYQDSIDTILGYGGKSTSNVNIYILPVIWVPDNSGYGGSFSATAVEEFNAKYIKPFAESKGYPFVDIYEDSKQVPHEAGNVHPSDYNKLYEIIKEHMGGSGSGKYGRGQDIINKSKRTAKYNPYSKNYSRIKLSSNSDESTNKGKTKKKTSSGKYHTIKFGRGIWGTGGGNNRDDQGSAANTQIKDLNNDTQDKLNSYEGNDNVNNEENTELEGEEEETEEETKTANSSSNSESTGFIRLFSKYSKAVTKGIFGDFYDALYGAEKDNSKINNSGSVSDIVDPGDREGRMKAIFEYMTGSGLSNDLTAGIMGNIRAESGFDPNVIYGGAHISSCTENQSVAYGLIQWCGSGSRASLYNWCTANGCDPDTLDGQTKWVVAQVKGINMESDNNPDNASKFNGSKGGALAYNYSLIQKGTGQWKGAKTFDELNKVSIRDAVIMWLYCVERPGNEAGHIETRLSYAKEVLKACTSGSGRGKEESSEDIIIKNTKNKPSKISTKGRSKYGRGIWGRDGETNPTDSDSTNNIVTTDPNNTTTTENTDNPDAENTEEETNTTSKSSKAGAETLLSKITKYSKAAVKGVYGDFYDALYGSEVEEDDSSSGGYTAGDGPIYAAAMVFEAMGKANPTFGYCSCGQNYFTIECRDGTKIERVRPDCSGMMSAVAQYMGYYTSYKGGGDSYTESYRGPGYSVGGFCTGSRVNFYNKDGTISSDWKVMDFNASDRQPGDMIIRNDGGHIDMYVFTDTNGIARGFNAGSGGQFPSGHCDSSGPGIEDSYNFAKYYLDNGNSLPPNDGSLGARTIQDGSASKVIRYIGSGNKNTNNNDEDTGSGRGRAKAKDIKFTDNVIRSGVKKASKYGDPKGVPKSVQRNIDNFYKNQPNRTGRGVLKSLDEVQSWNSGFTGVLGNNPNSTSTISSSSKSSVSTTTNNYNEASSYNRSTNNNQTSLELGQLIQLIQVISNNSDKIDTIIKLLSAIAVNTENTNNSISNKNKVSGAKNGLSALRSALNENGSGQDIINAVYQIAKS